MAAVALWWAGGGAGSADVASPDSGGSVVAGTHSGRVRGVANGGVEAFKGIPYAAPPVGNLRWRAPQPLAPWAGVLDATDYGMSCEQPGSIQFVPPGSRSETKSEDCLTLNVWTPVVRRKPLPVLVWIHGGGNVGGTSASRYYDGSSFARDGVVLISMNYRLGLFGFFAHPLLSEDGPGEGNFGFLDQIAALRWVRANVAAFGGDPKNVTLGGVSAGGEDTLLLATSSATTGLFERAISESAVDLWKPFPSLAEARARGALTAGTFGLAGGGATLAALRALPADRLASPQGDEIVGPIVDGGVIAGPASTAFEGPARVPVIVGTNSDDGSLLGDGGDSATVVPALHADARAMIMTSYAARGITGDAAVARKLFGDAEFAAPARWFAARTSAAGLPSYLYRFDYVASAIAKHGSSAMHSTEVPFVFETLPPHMLNGTDRAAEASIHGCWVAFVKAGLPTSAALGKWPPYAANSTTEMVFDAQPSVRDPDDADVIDLLERDLSPR